MNVKFTDVIDNCHLLQIDSFLFFCTEVFKKQLIQQFSTDTEKQANLFPRQALKSNSDRTHIVPLKLNASIRCSC